MPPPPKGKIPTKGAKQILSENTATVSFYRNMALGSGLFYNTVSVVFYFESLTLLSIIMNIFVIVLYVVCYQLMVHTSRAHYTDSGQLLDPGLDLNMEGGVGEHIKDLVILLSITHILATLSNYFWLLLVVIPLWMMYLFWRNIVGPWFFQQNDPEDTEQEEKKRKKMERRLKRYQQ